MPARILARSLEESVDLSSHALGARLRELELGREIETQTSPGGRIEILHAGWDRHLLAMGAEPAFMRVFWDRIRLERCELTRKWRCRLVYATPKQFGLHVVLTGMGLTELLAGSALDGPRLGLLLLFLNLLPFVSCVLVFRGFCKKLL